MLTINSEVLNSVQLREDSVLDKLSFYDWDSLYGVIRAAVGARSRRIAQSLLVLEAVMRSLDKKTQ
jgi:hypothetical protein